MRRSFSMSMMVLIALVALTALTGCKGLNEANTESVGAVLSTGTVEAEMPATATASPSASATESLLGTATTAPSASAPWPAKLGTFARTLKSPVWFPRSMPTGFKLDTVEVVELDAGAGLSCDLVYLSGDKAILLQQGSVKARAYEIVSAGKVPWGDETADIVHTDPQDPQSPVILVFSRGDNFAELQGDVPLDTLKAVAAGMVRVR